MAAAANLLVMPMNIRYKMKKVASNLTVLVVLSVFALGFLFPILVTLTNALMTSFEINNRYGMQVLPVNYFRLLDEIPHINFADMTLIPSWLSLEQYATLLFDTPSYMVHFWNSIIITVPSVMGQLLVAIPAVYVFEMSKWRHKEILFFTYIVVMLMPLPVVLVPQFVVAGFIGIQDSVLAVILPAIFSPFAVFLLRQFLKGVSMECLEAAKIDGAGHIVILAAIVTPLLKPAIVATGILIYIDYWNIVEQAIVFIPDVSRLPLSVALTNISPEIIFAAACFYMLPALLVFLYGQEYLVEGIQLSAIKTSGAAYEL